MGVTVRFSIRAFGTVDVFVERFNNQAAALKFLEKVVSVGYVAYNPEAQLVLDHQNVYITPSGIDQIHMDILY